MFAFLGQRRTLDSRRESAEPGWTSREPTGQTGSADRRIWLSPESPRFAWVYQNRLVTTRLDGWPWSNMVWWVNGGDLGDEVLTTVDVEGRLRWARDPVEVPVHRDLKRSARALPEVCLSSAKTRKGGLP